MKSIKTFNDPEAFQLLGDETRRRIIFLLRAKEMTVSQIAADLNLTPQAVYHHIKKLQRVDMVEVAREERVEHLIESYYRTTAEAFYFSMGNIPKSRETAKENMITALNALKRLGFKLEYDDKKIDKLIDLEQEAGACCSGRFDQKVSELDDVDFLTKQTVMELAEILSMTDKQYVQYQKQKEKFRQLLVSLLKSEK